jgi:hypothetical protein
MEALGPLQAEASSRTHRPQGTAHLNGLAVHLFYASVSINNFGKVS